MTLRVSKKTKKTLKTAAAIAIWGSGLYFLLFKPKLFLLWLIPGVPPPGPFGGGGSG